jgi:hypothetical protein
MERASKQRANSLIASDSEQAVQRQDEVWSLEAVGSASREACPRT